MPTHRGAVMLAALCLPAGSVASPVDQCRTLRRYLGSAAADAALADMREAGEGIPAGLPARVDWRTRGRLGLGTNPGSFGWLLPWGQVYADLRNRVPSKAVEVRRLETFVLSRRNGRWRTLIQTNSVGGALYDPASTSDVHAPTRETRTGALTASRAVAGSSWHFWSSGGRDRIDPSDVAGIFVSLQGRLAPGGRGDARYLLSAGADYWASQDGAFDNYRTNGDVGIGRFKVLGRDWRSAYMTTAGSAELDRCME